VEKDRVRAKAEAEGGRGKVRRKSETRKREKMAGSEGCYFGRCWAGQGLIPAPRDSTNVLKSNGLESI